jgi:hypothetical protein
MEFNNKFTYQNWGTPSQVTEMTTIFVIEICDCLFVCFHRREQIFSRTSEIKEQS